MKEGEEYLYALHQFDAENDDEVSFMAGERIIVREKDDAYNDGWYQVSRSELRLIPNDRQAWMDGWEAPSLISLFLPTLSSYYHSLL